MSKFDKHRNPLAGYKYEPMLKPSELNKEINAEIKKALEEINKNPDAIQNSKFVQLYIGKSIEEYIEENFERKIELFPPQADNVTEDDVMDFLMKSVKSKMRQIKKLMNGQGFNSWHDAERKARVLLTAFASSLKPGPENPHDMPKLLEICAIFFLGMIQFGKWSRDKNDVKQEKESEPAALTT